MGVDGVAADEEFVGDLLTGSAFEEELDDFDFSIGEGVLLF